MLEAIKINDYKLEKIIIRFSFVVLFLVPFIFYNDFFLHFYSHFTGSIIGSVIVGQWHIVLINILMFITFLLPLSFRRKINWKEYGLVTAFFVSLFIEMYGLPLTIFFASKIIAPSSTEGLAPIVYSFDFFGVQIAMSLAMLFASILMIIGTIIILIAWITLYKNLNENELVTNGIYSLSRHPQYFGFILIIIGWLIGWPTILTIIFAIILIIMYVRVCKIEENELSHIKEFKEYRKKVPFFI